MVWAIVNTLVIFCMLAGLAMFVVAVAQLLPEIGVENPMELLESLFGWDRENDVFNLIQQHIREGWPHTKPLAIMFHGGWLLMLGPALLSWVILKIFERL